MSFSRIAVTGANGQVGAALCALLGSKALPLTRAVFDLSDPDSLNAVLDQLKPDALINPAAYTAVDKAEDEPELAHTINSEAVGVMARWCAAHQVPFIHYSTDYVFDGSGDAPRPETAPTGPLNMYGKTKLAGEQAVAAAGGKWLIFRTSWVYDAAGKNFLNTMLRLGAERETLNIVADQHGAPTYAPHLAEASLAALEKASAMPSFPSGIYHAANTGETTWHGFASAIFDGARAASIPLKIKTVEPIPSSAYPVPAKRPFNSRLSMEKLNTLFDIALPDWREGVAEALKEKTRHASHRMPT